MEAMARPAVPRLARLEKSKLRQVLRFVDLYFFSVCAMLTFETLGQVSVAGGQALTWVVVCGLTFYLPYALITAELGSALPLEGGLYEWVRQGVGPYAAALTAFFYWISNPVWLGGIVTAICIGIVQAFITPLASKGAQVAVGLAIIWVCVVATIVGLRQGKWLPVSGAWAKVALVLGFVALAVAYVGRHGNAGLHAAGLAPSWPVLLAVLPALMFSYLGYELQSSAAEEMTAPQRQVPRAVFTSGLTVTLGYVVVIAAILAVVPARRLSAIGGLTDAFGLVSGSGGKLGGAGGTLIAAALLYTFLGTATAWLMGGDRSFAVAGMEGAAPPALGRLSARWGTPVRVNLLSGVVSTVVFAATAGLTGALGDQFSVALGLTVSVSLMSYLFVFPAFVALRRRRPDLPRPYRVPGGVAGAWAAMLLCEAYAVITTGFALWPPDSAVPASVGRVRFELIQGVALALIIVVATALYLWGRRRLRAWGLPSLDTHT
jgi:amino acid transporter